MIENSKNINFTEAGKVRLGKLHSDIDDQIINYLKERKNVPGDDFIEVTASDIDELSHRLKIVRPNKTVTKQIILNLYAIFGALTTLVGFFYSDFKKILFEDKERLVLILGGLSFTVAALTLSYLFKIKERREKEIIDYEREKMRRDYVKKSLF